VAEKRRPQLALADDDASLGDALDRWELSLFQSEPFRGEQLRHALESALGEEDGAWAAAMRGAALLGTTPQERAEQPQAGGVFVVRPGPKGRPANRFGCGAGLQLCDRDPQP